MVESCSKGWCVAASVFVLCAAAQTAGSDASEMSGRRIKSVRIGSDHRIDLKAIRGLLPFKVGEPLEAADIETAQRLLELKGVFRSVRIDLLPADPDAVVVRVRLKRKRVIGAVRVNGYDAISDNDVRRLIRLPLGTIFDPALVESARERVLERYRKLGFVDPRVVATVEDSDGEVDIDFVISEGPRLVIAAVQFRGGMVVSEKELRRATRTRYLRVFGRDLEGGPWTRVRQREAERAVLRLLRQHDYYDAQVTSTWEVGANHRGVLTLTIEAGPPFEITIVGDSERRLRKVLKENDIENRLVITDGTWRTIARRMAREDQEDGFYRARVRVEIEATTPKQVRFIIDRGRRYEVRQIEFRGNDALSAAQLRGVMMTRPARWVPFPRSGVLLDDVLADDVKRVRHEYRTHGFEQVQVADPQRTVDEETGAIDLVIEISEGPQTIVREVRYDGFAVLGDALPKPTIRAGKPLDPDAFDEERRALLRAFAHRGYGSAAVDAHVQREPGATHEDAVVIWTAQPGQQHRVGKILVQDNIDTRDEVIVRALPFREGDPLDTTALLQGQTNIYQLGLFRSVSVRPLDDGPPAGEVRDLGVMVSERPPGTLSWGVGFNTRDGFRGFGEAAYDNLNGMARRISLRGQISLDPTDVNASQYLATLTFREPRLAGSAWKLQTSIVGERSTQLIDPYSIERVVFLVNLERPITTHVRGGAEFQIEHANLFDVDPDVVLSSADVGTVNTIAPVVFLVYDARNDAFAPTAGRFDTINFRYALPGISTVEFPKITARHSQYLPVAEHFIFAYALRGGWGLALDGEEQLPINERFFLGGGGTVRGYSENSIGPLGADGEPIGGDVAINVNTEFRFPLVYGFGGAVFVDGGGVYLQNNDVLRATRGFIVGVSDFVPVCQSSCAFTFENFRWSTGLGLRYDTPIGPLSLDYGFKINRQSGESIGAVHFSVGAPF